MKLLVLRTRVLRTYKQLRTSSKRERVANKISFILIIRKPTEQIKTGFSLELYGLNTILFAGIRKVNRKINCFLYINNKILTLTGMRN